MAHECPDCGMQCHCGSDIDDCCNNFEDDVAACTHCAGRDDEPEWEGWEDEPGAPAASGDRGTR